MVEQTTQSPDDQLDLLFSALADRTRRAMLHRLAQGSCTVSELAEPFEMSLNGVSKHLKVLERAGLVSRRRDGRIHNMSAKLSPLLRISEEINRYEAFWNERLDQLEQFLEQTQEASK